jgi:choline kinase
LERINGAILAAGRGERLRAQGADLPKPLVALGGETLLARQARMLREAGADRVVAVVNSETAALIERDAIKLPQWLSLGVRDTANSMETLFELGEHLAGRWCLAATVDAILARGEMKRFAEQASALVSHQPHAIADGALGVVRWHDDERPLFVDIEPGGAIRKVGAAGGAMVTAGVYFLPTSIFSFRDRARSAGLSALRQFLGGLVEWGVRLHAIDLDGAIDIDTAEDLEAARLMLSREPKPDGSNL